MMSLLDKIKNMGKNQEFQKADLSETREAFVNPDRGMYQIFPFVLGEAADYARISDSILPTERLVLVIISIARYVEAELQEEALAQMREILDFFVEHDRDVILRVVYDSEGQAMGREPSLFSRVSAHMERIASLIAEYGERIFVYQGILVGAWGEMHGSRYLDEKHMGNLMALLKDHVRGEVFLAVRTPAQLRSIVGRVEWDLQSFRQMALFDDAILGSVTDCGTYSFQESERAEEKEFVKKLGTQSPIGGETVYGEGYAAGLTSEAVLQYLSGLHVTYLNRQHDPKLLDDWRSREYRGRSLYDYIEEHLGYRYLVKDVRRKTGAKEEIVLQICNTGFAPIYRKTQSFLCWESADGEKNEIPVDIELQKICGQAATTVTIPLAVQLPEGVARPVRWSLLTRRCFDGAVIRFANRQTPDGRVMLGELC